MEAFSTDTGTTYEDWDALVAAEASGFTVTAIITRAGKSWPWSEGPFPTQREAENARARMRTKMKREQDNYPDTTFKLFVRPLWKPDR